MLPHCCFSFKTEHDLKIKAKHEWLVFHSLCALVNSINRYNPFKSLWEVNMCISPYIPLSYILQPLQLDSRPGPKIPPVSANFDRIKNYRASIRNNSLSISFQTNSANKQKSRPRACLLVSYVNFSRLIMLFGIPLVPLDYSWQCHRLVSNPLVLPAPKQWCNLLPGKGKNRDRKQRHLDDFPPSSSSLLLLLCDCV